MRSRQVNGDDILPRPGPCLEFLWKWGCWFFAPSGLSDCTLIILPESREVNTICLSTCLFVSLAFRICCVSLYEKRKYVKILSLWFCVIRFLIVVFYFWFNRLKGRIVYSSIENLVDHFTSRKPWGIILYIIKVFLIQIVFSIANRKGSFKNQSGFLFSFFLESGVSLINIETFIFPNDILLCSNMTQGFQTNCQLKIDKKELEAKFPFIFLFWINGKKRKILEKWSRGLFFEVRISSISMGISFIFGPFVNSAEIWLYERSSWYVGINGGLQLKFNSVYLLRILNNLVSYCNEGIVPPAFTLHWCLSF